VDWYFKTALAVAIAWGVGRSLGVYGEAARELDFAFLYGFLLTLGGWGAVFFVIDRIAKFLGWKRAPEVGAAPDPAESGDPGDAALTKRAGSLLVSGPRSVASGEETAVRQTDTRATPRRTRKR